MWTSTGELVMDGFDRDVAEVIDAAIEFSARQRSRKFSYSELLWAIISIDTESKRFEGLEPEKKRIISDVKKIITRNFMPGINEESCLETLSYLVLQDNSRNNINYFEQKNWSDIIINIFKDVEAASSGNCELAAGIRLDSLESFNYPHFVLAVFNRLEDLYKDEKKYIDDLFHIFEIKNSISTYIMAGKEGSDSVFDEQGNLDTHSFRKNVFGLVMNSLKLAGAMGYPDVKPLHIFLAFLDDREGFGSMAVMRCLPVDESLKSLQIKLEKVLGKGPNIRIIQIPANKSGFSEKTIEILEDARLKCRQSGRKEIDAKQLLLSTMELGGEIFNITLANSLNIDLRSIVETAERLNEEEKQGISLPIELCPCCDLTGNVMDDGAPAILGRDAEIHEIIRIFFRKQNRNIILHGDRGIGKTAVSTALAQRIINHSIEFLKDYPVVYLDLTDIPEDELRGKVFRLLSFMEENHKRIYIVDGFFRLYSISPDLCKSSLKKNRYYFLGIIDSSDYSTMTKSRENFRDYFEFMHLSEPSMDIVTGIIENAAEGLLQEYEIEFEPNLVNRLIKFCADFLISERFPAKAINLLKLACSNASFERYSGNACENRTVVTKEHIAQQIALLTGLPADIVLGKGEGEDYAEILGKAVMGQDRAVNKVASRLKLVKAGMVDKNLPPAVFLFIGLSGTGKTELATEIAKVYSNSRKLITYAMENFKDKYHVSGIIGTSAGYVGYEEGGKLINDLNNDPYSVVLFDEIEKAHPNVWDPMLELFDKGNIRDLRGTIAYGNKAFFILTSNIGYEKIHTMLKENRTMEEIEKAILEELYSATHDETGLKCFRPEFIGRIVRLGGIVVFNPLSHMAIKRITQKVINKMCDEWRATREGELVVEPEVVDFIAQLSFEENNKCLTRVQDIDWLNYIPGQTNKSQPISYKGGRIIYNLVDEYVKNQLAERIAELHTAREVRVVRRGDGVDILCDATGEKSLESGENMKARIAAEILNSLSDLNASADRIARIPLRKVEKVKNYFDEILTIIKDI